MIARLHLPLVGKPEVNFCQLSFVDSLELNGHASEEHYYITRVTITRTQAAMQCDVFVIIVGLSIGQWLPFPLATRAFAFDCNLVKILLNLDCHESTGRNLARHIHMYNFRNSSISNSIQFNYLFPNEKIQTKKLQSNMQ